MLAPTTLRSCPPMWRRAARTHCRVSPRRATYFLCWCKGSRQRKHLKSIFHVATARCAPGGGGSGSRPWGLDSATWTSGAPGTAGDFEEYKEAGARFSLSSIERAGASGGHGADKSRCRAPLGETWGATTRSAASGQLVKNRFQVLSLLPFFAPAKKGSRPPGRDPAVRTKHRAQMQAAECADGSPPADWFAAAPRPGGG